MAADSISTRAKLRQSGRGVESGRQGNIDPVVKQINGEDDARERIAELKVQRLQIEVELTALGEVPSIATLHPANALAASLADHAVADDGTCRLAPLANPFGPKVLPMSSV